MVQVQQLAVEPEERNRPVAADILNFIDGRFVKGGSGATFPNIDPATGRETGRVHEATREDVDRAVAAAKRALTGPWGKMTQAERLRPIAAVGDESEAPPADFLDAEVAETG